MVGVEEGRIVLSKKFVLTFYFTHTNTMAPKGKGKQPTKKQTVRFVLDCEQPVNDQVLDPASFVSFVDFGRWI